MTSNTWRNIFIGIILLSIPCYLLGIGVWFFTGGGVQPTPTFTQRPSRTPIDPYQLETEFALTNPAAVLTVTTISSPTPIPGLGLTPIVPTSFTFPTSTPFVVSTATPQPPTNTPFPTNTPVPQNTPIPTPTPDILLPPTDTPSP